MKRLLVLGADGYLGFPVSLYLHLKVFRHAVDNLSKRHIENIEEVSPLIKLVPFRDRFAEWNNNCKDDSQKLRVI